MPHAHSGSTKHLVLALAITSSFFVVELVGGIVTKSLSLATDAWHMLIDVFALFFALLAAWFAKKPVDEKKTYGYYRAEILAGFLNGLFLWAVVVFIFIEAYNRILVPAQIQSLNMLTIAVFGFVANGLSALTLSKSKEENLNVKGAFIHVVADMLGSVGAISAGVIMFFTGWFRVDAVVSILIGVLVFYSSSKVVRDSLNILLEGAPSHIDVEALENRISQLEGVKKTHDLHVWCITPTRMCCMSVHVVVKKNTDRKKLLSTLIEVVKDEFGIDHTTVQLEDEGYPRAVSEH